MQNFKTLAQPLMGEFEWGSSCSCSSCSCYHGKTKSTPRFGLGWEFDNLTIEATFYFANIQKQAEVDRNVKMLKMSN